MKEQTKRETAPVAAGTASKPKNPTDEVKSSKSNPSVGASDDKRKLENTHDRGNPADAGTQGKHATLVEQVMAEYERERPLREAKSHFGHSDKPMLPDKGAYPIRYVLELDYWQRAERHDLRVSPWLADWENSLERAGWTVIRRPGGKNTVSDKHQGPYSIYPEDADVFCPWREIYLTLMPSNVPMAESWFAGVDDLCASYPGSLVIMHAREREKQFFQPRDDDFISNLLSAKNTARCIALKAVVEFNGMLYEPDEPAVEAGESLWHESQNLLAWEVYHEYRRNSLYYHADQEHADAEQARLKALEETVSAINPMVKG